MDKRVEAFKGNSFKVTNETTKGIEFENVVTREIVYLMPTVELSIVLNPKTVEGNSWLQNKAHGLYHNTALNQFPKRKNKGKSPIYYGYSFKFQTTEELSSFLSEMNSLGRESSIV
ncbi:hypothetical protein J7E38_17060 [Bacillus sp. ISL-35]|uniref:hypothetical protein n=1 Tax=Bacillus sp. ISL-35 TaxID=2819122 RepID=UPI001BE75832|nr:hypothetical protein [Bacillus sp. ISL-35]MBT2680722.1 hypothetical protein [Bacillus sp. ISL-35]MBT2702646.1 hypothetical protein [Chryseobacterium sp. ISL-80]